MESIDPSNFDTRGTPLQHSELEPAAHAVYRKIWSIVGPFQKTRTWEEFEFNCCRNTCAESDIPFFAYVCSRFSAFRAENPSCGTFKLKRVYNEIVTDYFRAHPYVTVLREDGTPEERLLKGFSHSTKAMRAEVERIAMKWLDDIDRNDQ